MRSAITPYYPSQNKFGLDVRMNMALAEKFTSADYVTAQRIRTRALQDFERLKGRCCRVPQPVAPLPPFRRLHLKKNLRRWATYGYHVCPR